MKKSGVFALVLLIGPMVSNAQGLYVDVNVGYGFPFITQTGILSNNTYVSYSNYDNNDFYSSYTDEAVALSLGKGVNFGASIGYMFNLHIGAEFQLSYLVGGKTEGTYSDQATYISGGITDMYTSSGTTTFSSNFFRAIPTIVLAAGTEKLNPYAKLGLVVGFGKINITDVSNISGDKQSYAAELNGGVSLGLNTRLGIEFGATANMKYFAEINIVSMNYSPKKGMIIEYKLNGVDMTNSLTTSEREVEFVDEVTFSESTPDNEPSQQLKMHMPFGSVGLNFGVRIAL